MRIRKPAPFLLSNETGRGFFMRFSGLVFDKGNREDIDVDGD